ncbi:NAD-binding protein [Lachnospiraceae bacterium LCP25S3_G4]
MRKKNVLLIGGFHKAESLAYALLHNGYEITIINNDMQHCTTLAENPRITIIKGDGTKPYVLEDARVREHEIAIALTQRDDDNLIICELCKKKYQVFRTVALVNDPKKTEFFYKMGIDAVVCAISAITEIIVQQAFVDKMATLIPVAEGNVAIVEVPILKESPIVGLQIKKLQLPQDAIIGCILRKNNSIIPRGDTRILEGDILVLIAAREQQIKAVQKLTGRCQR